MDSDDVDADELCPLVCWLCRRAGPARSGGFRLVQTSLGFWAAECQSCRDAPAGRADWTKEGF